MTDLTQRRSPNEMEALKASHREEYRLLWIACSKMTPNNADAVRLADEELERKYPADRSSPVAPDPYQAQEQERLGPHGLVVERETAIRELISDNCPADRFPAFNWRDVYGEAAREIHNAEAMPPLGVLAQKIPFGYEKHGRGPVNVWPERSRP